MHHLPFNRLMVVKKAASVGWVKCCKHYDHHVTFYTENGSNLLDNQAAKNCINTTLIIVCLHWSNVSKWCAANLMNLLIGRSLLLLQAGQRSRTARPGQLTSGRLLHQVASDPGVVFKSVTWTAKYFEPKRKNTRDANLMCYSETDLQPCFFFFFSKTYP